MRVLLSDRPEVAEEAISLEVVKEYEHGRRFHRARVALATYEEMRVRLFGGRRDLFASPESAPKSIRLHTPVGTIDVIADGFIDPGEAVLQYVPAQACRERATKARAAAQAREDAQRAELEEPGRQEWKTGRWAEACEAAAADGALVLSRNLDIPPQLKSQINGRINGFIRAAREDGFEARVIRASAAGTGCRAAMEISWDKPIDGAEEGS